jgi:hypothetical protein
MALLVRLQRLLAALALLAYILALALPQWSTGSVSGATTGTFTVGLWKACSDTNTVRALPPRSHTFFCIFDPPPTRRTLGPAAAAVHADRAVPLWALHAPASFLPDMCRRPV